MALRVLAERFCVGEGCVVPRRPRARAMGRRQFVQRAAGAAGLAMTANLWLPGLARGASSGSDPKPIPGGMAFLGPGTELFHVYPPARGFELSTITDFDGLIGASDIDGTGKGTDTATGKTSKMVFGSDMRFMIGDYVGVDGQKRTGAYALIWLDVYSGPVDPADPFAKQIHDFDPGNVPGGLLWTVAVPMESIAVDLASGTARFHVENHKITDYTSIPNALTHGKAKPGSVSFDIVWKGITGRSRVYDAANGYDAELLETGATIAWSGQSEGFSFTSDPASTSKRNFGAIGHERNGVYAGAASTGWPPLAVNGYATTDGKTVTYTYIVYNLSSGAVSGLDVRARIPSGSAVVDSWFAQPGHNPGVNNGLDVQWAAPVGSIGAQSSVGPFTLVASVPSGMPASQVTSLGWVSFGDPTPGTAVSGWIAGAP